MALEASATTAAVLVERLRLAPLSQPLHNALSGKQLDSRRVLRAPVVPRCTPRDSFRDRFAAAEAKLYAAERHNKALAMEKAELERENRQLHQHIADLTQSPRAHLDPASNLRIHAVVRAAAPPSSSSVDASPEAFPIHLCAQCHRVIQPVPTMQSRAVQVCDEALKEAAGSEQPDASSWEREDELASTCSGAALSDAEEPEVEVEMELDAYPTTTMVEPDTELVIARAAEGGHVADEADEDGATFLPTLNASRNRSAVMSGLLPTPRFTSEGRIVGDASPTASTGGASSDDAGSRRCPSRASIASNDLVIRHRPADFHHGTAVVGLLEGFLVHRRVEVAGLRRVAAAAEAEIQRIYELEEEDSRLRQEAALLRGEIECKRRIREMFADAPFLAKLKR